MNFGKSNDELIIGIQIGTGELLRVCDSFQAVAGLFIAGRFEFALTMLSGVSTSGDTLHSARCHVALLYVIGL